MTSYRRRHLRLFLAASLAVSLAVTLATGCGDDSDPAADVEVPDFQLEAVVLLDPGSGERTELRWTPQVGDEAQFVVGIAIETFIELPGLTSEAPIGPAEVTFDASVSAIGAGGEITTEYTITAGGVPDGSDPDLDQAMGRLVGVQITETVSATGLPLDRQVTTPTSLGPAEQSQLDRFLRELSGVFVPLPSEAVGAGAEWVYASAESIAEVEWTQSTTYELLAVPGGDGGEGGEIGAVRIGLEVADFATFQEIDTQGPTNVAGRVTGTGALEAALTALSPREGEASTELDLAVFTEDSRTGTSTNETETTLSSVDSES